MYISCWTNIDSMYSAEPARRKRVEGNLWCKNVTNCLLMSHANMIKVLINFYAA